MKQSSEEMQPSGSANKAFSKTTFLPSPPPRKSPNGADTAGFFSLSENISISSALSIWPDWALFRIHILLIMPMPFTFSNVNDFPAPMVSNGWTFAHYFLFLPGLLAHENFRVYSNGISILLYIGTKN